MAFSVLARTRPPAYNCLGLVFAQSSGSFYATHSHHLRACHSDIQNLDPESKLPLQHPAKGILMYAGKLSQATKGLKIFSLSTSLLALVSQPLILSTATEDFKLKAGLLGTFSIMVMSTPVLVQFVTKKYVTDIYFNSETSKFTLATRSLFLRRKEMEFEAKDVKVPMLGGMFTTHIIKGQPFFIELSEFRSKQVYIHMVGYDKAMEDPSKKKKKFGLWENEEETILQKEIKKIQEKRKEMDSSVSTRDSSSEVDKSPKDNLSHTKDKKKATSGV